MIDAKTIQQIADEFQTVFRQAVAESCAPLITDCCMCGGPAHFYEDEFAYICDDEHCMHAAAPEYVAARVTSGNYNGTPALRAITRRLVDVMKAERQAHLDSQIAESEARYQDWKEEQQMWRDLASGL